MKLKVEGCWSGGDNFYFRVSPTRALGNGAPSRFRVYGGDWSRSTASEARTEAARLYGVKRSNIRFVHH